MALEEDRKIVRWLRSWKTLAIFAIIVLGLSYTWYKRNGQERNVLATKVFLIARDPNFYPLNLMGRERSFVAFTNDLLYEIAKNNELKIQIFSLSSNVLFESLDNENVDSVLVALKPSPFMRQKYLISDSFYEVGPVVIVNVLSSFNSLKDLQNKVVGYRRGSQELYEFSQLNLLLRPFDSMTIAFDELEKRLIDGLILPLVPAHTYTNVFYSGKMRIITTPLNDEGLRLVSTKSEIHQILIERLNKGLKKIKLEGKYDELLKKWGLINPRQETTIPPASQPTKEPGIDEAGSTPLQESTNHEN
jgi:polar amino acid transport system substrate-binding protein